jgi:hypothetical protein
MEAAGDSTPEEPAEVSTTVVAQANVVHAEQESGTTAPPSPMVATVNDQLQNSLETSDNFNRADSSDTGTYLFWSPFRSTWAAQGFAGRLTLSTQVPVDVDNTAPGKYRVAFSYQDETDRLARIDRIETITGLKLE